MITPPPPRPRAGGFPEGISTGIVGYGETSANQQRVALSLIKGGFGRASGVVGVRLLLSVATRDIRRASSATGAWCALSPVSTTPARTPRAAAQPTAGSRASRACERLPAHASAPAPLPHVHRSSPGLPPPAHRAAAPTPWPSCMTSSPSSPTAMRTGLATTGWVAVCFRCAAQGAVQRAPSIGAPTPTLAPRPTAPLPPQLWLSRDGLQLGATDFAEGRLLMTTSPRRGETLGSVIPLN